MPPAIPDTKPLQDSGHVHQKPNLLQQARVVEAPSSSISIKFLPQTQLMTTQTTSEDAVVVEHDLSRIHPNLVSPPPLPPPPEPGGLPPAIPDAKPLQDSGHVYQKPNLLQQARVVEAPSSSTSI